MSEDLVTFLEKPGTVDILCALPPDGMGFGELLERVRISRGTLNRRLNEGLKSNKNNDFPGLWGRHTGKRTDGKAMYVLTQRGQQLQGAVKRHGLPTLLTEIVTKTTEFDRQKANLLDAVAEHGLDNLNDAYTNNND